MDTATLPTIDVRRDGRDWIITAAGTLTDEQAAAITFAEFDPAAVVLGAFVVVVDDGGQRIGYLAGAELVTRALAPSYVTVRIKLH